MCAQIFWKTKVRWLVAPELKLVNENSESESITKAVGHNDGWYSAVLRETPRNVSFLCVET